MAKKTIQQPVTKKEEDAADTLMAALTNIGQAQQLKQQNNQSTGPMNDRRSRFFFAPTISFTADVERRKTVSLPREVAIVDEQIEARRKTYVKEFPPRLNRNIEAVREFWLKDIAPLTLAAQSGSDQARDVIQRTLGEGVVLDATSFMQFQVMVQKGSTIKLAEYIAKFLKLPQGSATDLLESVKIHRPQREIVYVNDNERRERTPPAPSPDRNLTATDKKEPDDE